MVPTEARGSAFDSRGLSFREPETPVFLPLKDENPTYRTPWVVAGLIALNLIAFVYPWVSRETPDQLVTRFGMVPARVSSDPIASEVWVTLFSSMFLHGGVVHLFGNLLYLWIFGNNVEDVLGHVRFTLFYVLVGLAAHGAHVLTNPGSPVPTVGASGAIAGILAAYLIRYPHAKVVSAIFLVFFVRLVRVPAGLVIGIWLAVQLLGGVGEIGKAAPGGIAWFEHLGGFVAGLILFPLMGGKRGWR